MPKNIGPNAWLIAGCAIVVAQLLSTYWAEPYVDTISAGMALLAMLCAARTIRLTPALGVPDRWRWQAGSFAWLLWAAQWITNAVQDSLIGEDQLLAKGLSEARLAVLVFALMPLAAPGDDRRLRWLDAVFALAFTVLMTMLSWPDLFEADPLGPDKSFLYLGYIAMASFAGLSMIGNPIRPLRRMSRALFVTLSAYAAVGISSRELIEHGWLGIDAPVFAYGDVPFLAYLALIGQPVHGGGPDDAREFRSVLLARLVPLAVTILVVALSFIVACSSPGNALAAGAMALAVLLAYAARTALVEALHHHRREAAFVREQTRAAGLADLMHELRSPLGAIALNGSVVRRMIGKQPVVERAAIAIENGCMTISRLLDDVLALERLEAGLTSPVVARHDLAAITREVVAMLSAEAEEYGVILTMHLLPAGVAIDGAAFRRVVTNLLDNALRFTPRGGQVTLSLTQGQGQYQLTITDTGTGLSPEVRAAPFRRFASVARPLNGRRGSGLGLAITHALVQAIGGTISVDPQSDAGGTTFRLLLPAAA